MTHKEELRQSIEILKRNIENPVLQCDPLSRNATRSNYEVQILFPFTR